MVRALVILLMAVAVSRAEWYFGTNSDGRVVSVPVRTDPALDAVVGHITTNAEPYVASEQVQDVAALLESARTNLVSLSTQSTTAAAQSNQIERLRRALLIITDALKDQP